MNRLLAFVFVEDNGADVLMAEVPGHHQQDIIRRCTRTVIAGREFGVVAAEVLDKLDSCMEALADSERELVVESPSPGAPQGQN